MRESQFQKPTLKRYLQNYTKLKKSKSTGSLYSQKHHQQQSGQQLLRLIIENIHHIQDLLTQKKQMDTSDRQILNHILQTKNYLDMLSNHMIPLQINVSNDKQVEQEYFQMKSKNIQSSHQLGAVQTKKYLLSPIQLNKNFDSIMISASNIGTKLLIPSQDSSNRFVKYGSSFADNSGKSLKRMDIDNSIKINQKTNKGQKSLEPSIRIGENIKKDRNTPYFDRSKKKIK